MRLSFSRAARPRRAHSHRFVLTALLVGLAACSSADATGPSPSNTASLSVDASTQTAFIHLAEQPATVTGADTTSATAWDISFNATTVTLNTAGGVTAYCLCEHETATDAEVMAFTADAENATFAAVISADIPAAASFGTDVFSARKWYRYNLTGNDHQIWPTFNVYLIKRGSSIYKVQITGYYDATGASRHISIRSAVLRS